MRRLLFLLLGLAVSLAAQPAADEDPMDPLAGSPEPLAAAIRAYGRDAGRWAYTQQIIQYDRKGRVEQEQLARFDPSQHYDVQWTLLKQNGKEATESQAKKFRKERTKMSKNRRTLGELLVLKEAKLVRESGDELVYEVPLKKDEENRLLPALAGLARKLELAEEFRQIGDLEGARDLLEEVVAKSEGTLRSKAQAMLDNLA